MRNEDFERLYEQHARPLLAFLVYRTGDQALAEDLLADTFERVIRSGWRFDRRRASEKTWLYTIALNLLRDRARREAVASRALEQVGVGEGQGTGVEGISLVEERDALQRALVHLTPEEREAVALRFGADLTVPDIAKVLGTKVSTIEGRVHRSLKKLRDHFE